MMAIRDVLPSRELSHDEFQQLQRSDKFDEVYTADNPGRIDWLILKIDGEEHTLHYSDSSGWHKHDDSHGHE